MYGSLLTVRAAYSEYGMQITRRQIACPCRSRRRSSSCLTPIGSISMTGQPNTSATDMLLASIVSYQNESTGFNHIVQPALTASHVERLGDDTIIVRLPPAPFYQITKPETIQVTVPAAALDGGRDLHVPYNFTIRPNPGSITLSGPPIAASSEEYMREAIYNRTIRVTLVDDEWDPVLMEGRATRSYLVADDSPQPSTIWDMIYGLTSRQNEARGFTRGDQPVVRACPRAKQV